MLCRKYGVYRTSEIVPCLKAFLQKIKEELILELGSLA